MDLDKEGKWLEKLSEELEEKILKSRAKNDLLVKSCEQTEQDIKQVQNDQSSVKRDMAIIEENIMRFHTEIKSKTNDILIMLSGLKTEEKMTQQVIKQILETRQK